ncbi:MAG TPA: hypothetical protein VHW23_09770 [Kofleriaceae bacterium]|nr:hypothetical protein [Kofleriaceae bacterium]
MFLIRERFWILGFTSVLTACLPNPATGVAANGGPLRVQYRTGTGTFVSNDKTGEDVTTHSDGSESVTEHYQPVEHSYRWSDWRYFQGRSELDEQDYYRIAGDDGAARNIEDIRGDAAVKMKIGAPLLILGSVASFLLPAIGSSNGNKNLSTLGYVGGGLVGVTGGLVWYWGRNEMANRHHLPQARADEHADVIEECDEGRCKRQRGGRAPAPPPPPPPPPPPAAAAPPPPAPPPPAPPPPRRRKARTH